MARHGLNCVLGYSDGKAIRTYGVRCDQVSHGAVMVYEESQARTRRAFFPHRRADDKFSINIMLIGQKERKSFVNWLYGYAQFILDTDLAVGQFPPMTVNIPSRNFFKPGIPMTGIEWGDHVGSMVWNHAVIFESIPAQVAVSKSSQWRDVNGGIDPANSFFYPFQDQLSGDKAPAVYQQVVTNLATVTPDVFVDTSNQQGIATASGSTP